MKIRQKIAMLLATAMVVTAVPAMTMAKSNYGLTNGIVVKNKDGNNASENIVKLGEAGLKVEVKDITTSSVFFVSLDKAKWQFEKTTAANVTTMNSYSKAPTGYTVDVKKNNDTELEVRLTMPATAQDGDTFVIPLWAELTGGDATVAVDGNGSVVSDMSPVVFAKTSDKKATVTFGDAKNIYKNGTTAEITIEEPLVKTMSTGNWITLELDNTDYQFASASTSTPKAFTVEWSKGFSTQTGNVSGLKYGTIGSEIDYSTIMFQLPAQSVSAPGRLKIKNLDIKLKGTKSFIENDDINLTVKGDDITETTGKVAVAKYLSCDIEMKDKKVVDIVAGKNEKVEFTVFENVNDSMLDRAVEVRIENAFFFDGKTTYNDLKANASTEATAEKQEMKITLKAANDVDFTAGAYGPASTFTGLDLTWVKDKDNKVIGFDFTIPAGTVRPNDIDKIKFSDVKIFAPLNATGDVKITVNGRGVGSEISTVAANIIAPVEITNDQFTVKVGLKEQLGGKLVIKETDKARFQNSKEIKIAFDSKENGFAFTAKPTVKVVEGDLKLDLDKMEQKDGYITIPVSRASKTASTIEITNFKVKVDRTVPQGKYDLKVDGPALEPGCAMEALTVKDFLNVATANTEDLTTNNGLRKGVASFVIGSDKFIVNGVEATMDAKAYLDPAGRTMVPLRFVANALGIEDTSIFYAQKTATIVAGAKTISLTLGDKLAKINGVPAKVMDVAPTMVNDRVYVPVGELANLLSVEAVWDGATQTATFTVK